VGIAFILLRILIVSASAFIYESAQQTAGQTIVKLTTLTLQNTALGNLEEGETKSYTRTNVARALKTRKLPSPKTGILVHYPKRFFNH
jgi:hypothetical protein